VDAQAVAYNKKKSAIWKQLWSVERIQVTACQVKHALGQDKQFWAFAVVKATLLTGVHQDFTSQVELESACLAKASNQFTQAKDTPFLQPPLLEAFGETGFQSRAFDSWGYIQDPR